MLQATTNRVAAHTPTAINERIKRKTESTIAYFAEHPEKIHERLDELDREWDIERVLETNASALALTGVILGAMVDRRFLILPALVTASCCSTRFRAGARQYPYCAVSASEPPPRSPRSATR